MQLTPTRARLSDWGKTIRSLVGPRLRRAQRRMNAALFGRVALNQQLIRESISRSLFEYPVTWHGQDEIYAPKLDAHNPCARYPHLAMHYMAQAVPRLGRFVVPNALVSISMIIDPMRPHRLFLETYPEPLRFEEDKVWNYDPLTRNLVIRRMRNRAADYAEAYLFSNMWWHRYYHFVVDSCLRFVALDDAGAFGPSTTMLFHVAPRSWQNEYLALLGIPDRPTGVFKERVCKVERLLIGTPRRAGMVCSFEAVRLLRHRLFERLDIRLTQERRKVYITRRDADIRRVTNEEEIIHLLERRGFEAFALSGLPVAEQIRLFAGAGTVVAPHGAGLTNILYADRPKVVELLPSARWNMGYFLTMTNVIGGTHVPLVSDAAGATDPDPLGKNDADFTVDPRALEALLDSIEA